MLAFSSAWKSSLSSRGGAILDPLLDVLLRHPLGGLVLDEGVSSQALEDLRPFFERREVPVLALRGVVGRPVPRDSGVFQGEAPEAPAPSWLSASPSGGRARGRQSWFDAPNPGAPAPRAPPPPSAPAPIAYALRPRLCSPDPDERAAAVAEWTRVLELAHDRELSLVCATLGAIDPEAAEPFSGLSRALEELEVQALGRALRRAQPVRPRCRDGARFSLEALLRRAEPLGVTLAVENVVLPLQLPSPEELSSFLREFSGAPLAYAHDVGAARVCRALGGAPGREYLDAAKTALRLLFLSDAKGTERGLIPGRGDVDFDGLRSALPAVPGVLVPRADWSVRDVDEALDHLRAAGF